MSGTATMEGGGIAAPDLAPFTAALAAAIHHRHALGNEVPAQIAVAAELKVREAETALGRARAGFRV
jgi:hypothetical protein